MAAKKSPSHSAKKKKPASKKSTAKNTSSARTAKQKSVKTSTGQKKPPAKSRRAASNKGQAGAAARKLPVKKKKTVKKLKGMCFVLMPFKEPFDTYYSLIIKPAVISAGLECRRGDSLFRPTPIMGDVWSMIQEAEVLVAELTEKNANVFYELGLGHAIGKPIILMSETIEDVPFDLQPLRVIIYDKDDPAWGTKLRSSLIASLEETLADSTNAVPSMFRKKVKSQAPEEFDMTSRLSSLERQLASLQGGEMVGGSFVGTVPPMSSVTEFRRNLSRVQSRNEAVALTRRALDRGFPRKLVQYELKNRLGSDEGERVLKLALSDPSLFLPTL